MRPTRLMIALASALCLCLPAVAAPAPDPAAPVLVACCSPADAQATASDASGRPGKPGRRHTHRKNRAHDRASSEHSAPRGHSPVGELTTDFSSGYQANVPRDHGYTMFEVRRLTSLREGRHPLFNPSIGVGGAWGFDMGYQLNGTHTLMYGGLVAQNTSHFGPLSVTLGVLAGPAMSTTVTQAMTFQDTYMFLVADPRLTIAWQFDRHLTAGIYGNYLLTTYTSAQGGPGFGANLALTF